MSKFYNEKGEPRIVRPTGNYDEDFQTAVDMYTIGHSNYVRFLNDFRNVHNIIKIKSGDANKNWVDYLELKKAVEEYAEKIKANNTIEYD